MKQKIPTLDHVWMAIALGLVALRPLLTPIPPHDFWWHMATGRITITTAVIPTTDTFSYTQFGEPFYNQGWLAQAFMYFVHSLGGVELLLVVQAVVITFTYGLLLYLCIRRSGALRLSVVLMLLTVMPMSFDNWNVRPQTYAFPLFMAFLVILTIWRTQQPNLAHPRPSWRTGPLWALPLLMAVWVNLHGSFVLGGVLITLVFVGEWVRRLAGKRRQRVGNEQSTDIQSKPQNQQPYPPLRDLFVWGAITALAIFLNPRGPAVYAYVFNLLNTSAVTRMVTEWAPPTVRDTNGAIFFLFLIMVMLILAYTSRRPDGVDMLIVVPFLWLALGASRNIVWFGMVITPLLVQQVASWATSTRHDMHRARGVPMMNGILIGFVALLLFLALPWIKPHLGLPPELGNLLSPKTPVQAVHAIRDDPKRPQHLFHAMSYGSYLIWAVPSQPVFADPRIELYPTSQWLDYIALNNGTNVDELISRYDIDGLLLDRDEQKGLLNAIADDPSWVVRYEDDNTVYLTRDIGSG